jgi:hypothetical protein
MRSTKSLHPLLVIFAIALGACGDDDAAPSSMRFLGQTDYGCTASRGGVVECPEGATLTRVEALGDTVVLWIRFEANCCPEFTEHATYDAGVLTIDVVDTLYGCRCICPFENEFRFLLEGSGDLRVLFASRAGSSGDACLSGLDTTITMP